MTEQTIIITEREISLIGRRLNAGKSLETDTYLQRLYTQAEEEGIAITPEQTKKGLDWLMNEWKTPRGVERKNNPFGMRESQVLEGFKEFEYCGHANVGNYGNDFYIPMYRVIDTEGYSFQYYVQGGRVVIIG